MTSPIANINAALARDKRPTSILEMPGIANLSAGGLLRQGEATFAELYSDPSQSHLIETAAKVVAKRMRSPNT